jgi:hypothetical protein
LAETAAHDGEAGPRFGDGDRASRWRRIAGWLAGASDRSLVALIASVLFAMAAWPLLLVAMPPLQDLPNHVASAYIIAHPEIYPQYVFNGFLKSNALLTLWLHLLGPYGLVGAARAFTALVLATNALALPIFVLRFAGRRSLATGILFAWPLVHGFFVAMGMLNFAFAFALSLLLLVFVDRQRARPSVLRGLGIALTAGVLWYAHPFPLLVVIALAAVHALGRATWRERARAGLALLAPLAPFALLFLVSAQRHLVKADHARQGVEFAYLPPWETVAHVWLDASGALTRWGGVTLVPAVLLVYYAWKQRRFLRPLFSPLAMAALALAYLALPTMVSNWWYLNCRLVPFLWAGAIIRLPARLPKSVVAVLAASALWFSVALGVDYVRLDRDRAAFDAGIVAVPAQATLLPLLFKHSKTSDFIASLTHAWADYVLARNTSAPLVFAVERSYPITYRSLPPAALIPPALDRFAEKHGTPAQVCRLLRPDRPQVDAECTAEWRRQWSEFWREAEPRFNHVLTWAMPAEARAMIPTSYRRVFAENELAIYERLPAKIGVSAPSRGDFTQ